MANVTSAAVGQSPSLKALHAPEVYERLGTRPTGLTDDEARIRLGQYGPNQVQQAPRIPLLLRLVHNLTHFFAILLWVAAALSFVAGTLELGWAIIAVIVINAGFSFWQEYKAEKAVDALRRLLPQQAKVVRTGREQVVLASELVPGDVILLSEGDSISVDARLVEAFQLRTDNATLTGESLPVPKTADPVFEEVSITELPNYVFAGTSVVTGSGRAVVYATGMQTEFGKIARLTQTVEVGLSPLQKQMVQVTRIVAVLAIGIGLVFFALSLIVGLGFVPALLFGIGIIVANVPEGLLPTVTLALAIGVQQMARRRALVKKLSSVETLGSCTAICTDKTGTLTQNEMTVRGIWAGGRRYEVTGVGYAPKGLILSDGEPTAVGQHPSLVRILEASVLANNARLVPPANSQSNWTVLGDPTEGALIVAAQKAGLDYRQIRKAVPRIYELAFDPNRKRMSTVNQRGPELVVNLKGAPREVLALCTRTLTDRGEIELTCEQRNDIMAQNDAFASQGLRVLGIASRRLHSRPADYRATDIEQDLTFLGLMAMMDPPRPEVAQAVDVAHAASIRVIMITGDYGLTAESIGRRVGIISSPRPRIVTGLELDTMTDEELRQLLEAAPEVLFARVSPEHKMRVVGALRDLGEVVAVTGDGVNDAPALKRADIGVAMGIAGTDVAKEAAELILTDDNFATIIAAIEQGRAVYDNIKKFVTYIFASNIPEIVPFILAVTLGIPLPLTVLQILAIDLGTDIVPALALGTERPEPGVMRRPASEQRRPILSRPVLTRAYGFLGVIEAIAAMSGFYFVYLTTGWRPGDPMVDTGPIYVLATTMTFATIVFSQIGNGFATRTERVSVFTVGLFSNRLLLVGIAIELALLIVLSYVPFFGAIFHMAPLRPIDWLFLLIWPPVVLGAEELRKYAVRRRSLGVY